MEQWLTSRSPPDLDVGLQILDGVCAGLGAIHAAETVHRDLKPSNVLLDMHLKPHIADLGLAMICQDDAVRRSEIVGTPAYMAPEIAFSSEFAPAAPALADVYSLGCLTYEVLTGKPPYGGRGANGPHRAAHGRYDHGAEHASPRPPSRVQRSIILRALAKNPAERTPSRRGLPPRAHRDAGGHLGAGAHSRRRRPRRLPRIARDHPRPRIPRRGD